MKILVSVLLVIFFINCKNRQNDSISSVKNESETKMGEGEPGPPNCPEGDSFSFRLEKPPRKLKADDFSSYFSLSSEIYGPGFRQIRFDACDDSNTGKTELKQIVLGTLKINPMSPDSPPEYELKYITNPVFEKMKGFDTFFSGAVRDLDALLKVDKWWIDYLNLKGFSVDGTFGFQVLTSSFGKVQDNKFVSDGYVLAGKVDIGDPFKPHTSEIETDCSKISGYERYTKTITMLDVSFASTFCFGAVNMNMPTGGYQYVFESINIIDKSAGQSGVEFQLQTPEDFKTFFYHKETHHGFSDTIKFSFPEAEYEFYYPDDSSGQMGFRKKYPSGMLKEEKMNCAFLFQCFGVER